MAVITSVLGWSLFGLGTRCYALGIQRRYVWDNLGVHATFMGVGGAVGYYLHGLGLRQEELLAKQRDRIQHLNAQRAERLDERLAEIASKKGH